MSTFTDSDGKDWTITVEPNCPNKDDTFHPFDTKGAWYDNIKREKWMGGTATNSEFGTIKLYGARFNAENAGDFVIGNIFPPTNPELNLVDSEAAYKNEISYKTFTDASLDHCAGERGEIQGRSTCSTKDALANCKMIKRYGRRPIERCSDDEIRLKIVNFYFTWKESQ